VTKIITAPEPLCINPDNFVIFLAGSIEMGTAEDWQKKVIRKLEGRLRLTILNPRRADFYAYQKQDILNPYFYGQVTWELNALERADRILMYFAPDTKSPISLLELGLFAHERSKENGSKLIVCCPDGFWRKGNVEMVCQRYGIKMVDDVVALSDSIVSECEWAFTNGHGAL
jgi:hypothetical protein